MKRDVMVCVLLAACGGSNGDGKLIDAPGAGGEAGPTVDGVVVTVTLGGRPVADRPVYFQSGSATELRMTDASGVAHAELAAGGSVTVVEPEAPAVASALGPVTHLSTIVDVQPTDHIAVDVPVSGRAALTTTNVTVTLAGAAQGDDYTLQASCGAAGLLGRGTGAALTKQLALADCSGTHDVMVVGRDPATNAIHSWAYKAGVSLSDGATLAFDALAPTTSLTFTYRNPTSAITGVEVGRVLRSAHGTLSGVASFAGLAANAAYQVKILDAASPDLRAVTTSIAEATEGFGQHTIVTWGPSTAGADLDFTADQLHRYVGIPTFTAATQTLAWTEDARVGAAPDFAIGVVRAVRSDQAGHHDLTWRIVAPYRSATQLTYPTLPDAELAFRAADQPVVDSLTTVRAGGYDAARARVLAGGLAALADGDTGKIVAEDMFFAPINSAR